MNIETRKFIVGFISCYLADRSLIANIELLRTDPYNVYGMWFAALALLMWIFGGLTILGTIKNTKKEQLNPDLYNKILAENIEEHKDLTIAYEFAQREYEKRVNEYLSKI